MRRTFLAFIKKETYHILRDTRTLVILFGLPVALVLIFGYTVTNEFRNASIAILDQSKDGLSQSLGDHLISSGHFQLVEYLENIGQVEKAFENGHIKMAVVFPPQFEENFYSPEGNTVQLITDATEPNYASTLTSYASRMIKSFQKNQIETIEVPYQINTEVLMFYNPKLIGAYNFIPGVIALILLLISAMMTSLTIAREKETGTMDLLLVSPLHPLIIILGKVVPYVALSFISTLIVLAMGYVIFDVPVVGSLSLLLVLCLLYLFVALGLGVLISTKADSQQTAMIFSLFTLLMPTMLLSGFIFPIASMPSILQYISTIIPAKYFIIIEKAVMLKGAGLEAVTQPALVLVLMAVILFVAAWRNFKVIYN